MKKSFKKKSKFPDYHVIYGMNGCEQVLRAKHLQIMNIDVMKEGNAIRKSSLSNELGRFKGRVNNLPKDQYLKKYTGLRTQGIVVQFKGEVYKKLTSFKNTDPNLFLLILDNIEDPQNLGQIIRTAECGGVDGIIIPEHHSVGLTQTAMQVSQGAFVHIPIYKCTNLRNQLNELKKDGFWTVALENSIKAKKWFDIDMKGKIAVVLGSEGKGIRQLVLNTCDFHATIPMKGKINSLNVSATVSAMVFERLRQISN
ncbi:MAG: 23S rRNA (guanosine(2251)-2'-O)-methyltransferase RlmB [Candidatus Marinimicrobia bacterium]|nr:23S rRNA (guanosine(2251)-2'-O)-methyltransferase RlmB [Candidatus Neomarinimicrobiota bacterium]